MNIPMPPRRRPIAFAALLLVWTVLAVQVAPRLTFGRLGPPPALPPLRVGMDPSFTPFEFFPGPNQAPLGYDVDLAGTLAKRIGREAVIVPTSYDGLVDGLLTGKLDVVISAFPYDPRLTQDLKFTGAYFNAGPVYIVRPGQPLPAAPQRLAVEFGSAADAAARRLRPAPPTILRLPTPDAVVEAVAAGAADAGLIDMVAALQAGDRVQPVGDPIADEFYVVAVRKDNDGLFAGLNFTLEALRREGYLDRLAEQWMGRAPPR